MKKAMTALFFSSTLLLAGCNAHLKNKAKAHAPILFTFFETELAQRLTIKNTRYVAAEMIGHGEDEVVYMTGLFFEFKIPTDPITYYAGGMVAETLDFTATSLGGVIYESIEELETDYEKTIEQYETLKKDAVGKGKDLKALNYHVGTLKESENNAR